MGIGGIVVISVVSFVLLIIIIGFLLPRKVHVERAVIVSNSPSTLFLEISDLKRFHEWSPWREKDPDAVYEFSDPSTGVGAEFSWKGHRKKVGVGSMTITDLTPDKKVSFHLDFGKRGVANCAFILEPKNDDTKVIWSFDSDLGANPIARYFGLLMDKFLGPDFEHGLHKLKARSEGD